MVREPQTRAPIPCHVGSFDASGNNLETGLARARQAGLAFGARAFFPVGCRFGKLLRHHTPRFIR